MQHKSERIEYKRQMLDELYESCPVQPTIEVTANAFKLVLPNMNACTPDAAPVSDTTAIKPIPLFTPQMKAVLDYLAKHGEMTDGELQELLHIKISKRWSK